MAETVDKPAGLSDLKSRNGRGRRSALFRQSLTPYLWVIPILVAMGIVILYPWGWAFWKSFFDQNVLSLEPAQWVGLSNYLEELRSGPFWSATGKTFLLIGVAVPLEMILGIGFAVLLAERLRGRSMYRTILMLPMMIMPVMIGVAWQILLDPVFGVVNYISGLLGLPEIAWLTSSKIALFTVATMEIWRLTPLVTLITLAGLQGVPEELSDACRVDGANRFQEFRYVTLAIIRPFVMFSLLLVITFQLRTFDVVYSLFQSGGPGDGAGVLGVHLYRVFTNTYEIGRSSALSYLLLAITIAVSMWFARGTVRRVGE